MYHISLLHYLLSTSLNKSSIEPRLFLRTGGSELADGRSHPLPPAEGWRAAGGASTALRHGAPEPPAPLRSNKNHKQ